MDARTSPSAQALAVASPHYRVVPSEQLPSLDPSVQVYQLIFSSDKCAHYSRLVKGLERWFVPLYSLVLVLRALVVFVDASLGCKLAPLAFIFQLPLFIGFVLSLSVDFARLLSRILDFWLHGLTISVWIVCLSITFRDPRVFILPGCLIDCMNAVLVEANLRAGLAVIAVVVVAAFVCAAGSYVCCVAGSGPRREIRGSSHCSTLDCEYQGPDAQCYGHNLHAAYPHSLPEAYNAQTRA